MATDPYWSEIEFLNQTGVAERLGTSEEHVAGTLDQQRLIALRDRDGRLLFPAFQFHRGEPLGALIDAFWIVASAPVDAWTAASWCVADDDALDGASPVAWARAGRDAERLLRIARQDAARLRA
jgi:hypothetical protein